MILPGLIAFVHLFGASLALTLKGGQLGHFPALMLDVGGIQGHNHLAGICQPVVKTQKQNSVGYGDHAGFPGVELTFEGSELLRNARLAFKQILRILMNQDEIVHVPDVKLDAQLFLDEMVERIQDADSGDLNHLASRIVTDLTIILVVQNAAGLLVSPAVDHLPEAVLYHLVRHVRVIALDVAFQHISRCAVLSVKPLQKVLQPHTRFFTFTTICPQYATRRELRWKMRCARSIK